MARSSSFLPRNPFHRDNQGPILPRHQNPSEYSLRDLSPRPEGAFLDDPDSQQRSAPPRSPSPPMSSSSKGSYSKTAKKKTRFLFAGPPPPIVSSVYLRQDPELARPGASRRSSGGISASRPALASRLLDSVAGRSPSSTKVPSRTREPETMDTVWRTLVRREKGLHADIQAFLDAQEVGLGSGPRARDEVSSTAYGSTGTPTEGSCTPTTSEPHPRRNGSSTMASSILEATTTHVTPQGTVVPVRQPRSKTPTLRAARMGITRAIASLASLKAEEDALVSSAVAQRKQALATARRLGTQRENIVSELKTLEEDEEEPLGKDMRELGEESEKVGREIQELEARLKLLRQRKGYLDAKKEDVRSRREAGLSGYRGALREVEADVERLLRRPPVRPLDLVALGNVGEEVVEGPGGDEFLRLRADRRTLDMAREWWEGEVGLLEKRRENVAMERNALEEGAKVWKAALKLVSDFEAGLRAEVNGNGVASAKLHPPGKGKERQMQPEEAILRTQLAKMELVLDGLGDELALAEEKNWTLLMCAIGAELEAFRQGKEVLKGLLRAKGYVVPSAYGGAQDDSLPVSFVTAGSGSGNDNRELVDFSEDPTTADNGNGDGEHLLVNDQQQHTSDRHKLEVMDDGLESRISRPGLQTEDTAESDNEVPADLLVSAHHHEEEQHLEPLEEEVVARGSPGLEGEEHASNHAVKDQVEEWDREGSCAQARPILLHEVSSENEIPPEFLAEHHPGMDSQEMVD